MLSLGIFGRGRLSTAIAEELAASSPETKLRILWRLGRDQAVPEAVDLAIDASHGSAVPGHLDWAARTACPLLIATTGWDTAILDDPPALAGLPPALAGLPPALAGLPPALAGLPPALMLAPNLSLSMALFRRMTRYLGAFSRLVPGDLAIFERHHRYKQDQPSGSALSLVRSLCQGNPGLEGWHQGPARENSVHIASQRCGLVVGDHQVRYESEDEIITLEHSAINRHGFARGAILAAAWLYGRLGRFSFDDFAMDYCLGQCTEGEPA